MTKSGEEGDNGLRLLTADMCLRRVLGPEVEPSRLGTACTNDETGAEIEDDSSVVANAVVGGQLTPTMGAMLVGKMFVLLSELGSLSPSIDDGMRARDN